MIRNHGAKSDTLGSPAQMIPGNCHGIHSAERYAMIVPLVVRKIMLGGIFSLPGVAP